MSAFGGEVVARQVRKALRDLLGSGYRLRVENWNERGFETAKWISYTSELADPLLGDRPVVTSNS